jgi:hypothetical protein
VTDHRGDLAVSHEFLSDFRGDGPVALIVAGDHLESVAVYASGFIDLFGRQLYTLEVL